MRNRLRDLADARRELLEIERGFAHLQQRVEAVRDCVMASVTRIFGEESPALDVLAEEDFIKKVAGRIAACLGTQPAAPKQIGNRYVREKEAAVFLGVSVQTLRAWRSRVSGDHPPVTRVGSMVMYSKKALEEYMEQRTIGRSISRRGL